MSSATEIWHKTESQFNPKKNAYLTIIKGEHLGETFQLTKDTIELGRDDNADIVIPDKSISRRHLLIEFKEPFYYASDLNSTNGSKINNKKITARQQLNDGDKIRIAGTVFRFSYLDAEETHYQQQMRELVVTDGLTQIYNKRYFMKTMDKEFNFAKRNQQLLSLILFDIDYFKSLNDQYGHQAGDFVLKEIVEQCKPVARNYDTFARFGGEEFALLLRETDQEKAIILAERLRYTVENIHFNYQNNRLKSTISLGIATYTPSGNINNPQQLISIADQYLYQAKNTGRNRVCY